MTVSMTYDYNNAMAEVIGGRHGLTRSMLEDLEGHAAKAHAEIQALRENGTIGFYDLADVAARAGELDRIEALGNEIARAFENFVLLGIGGSALGPLCVQNALGHPYHNLLDRAARKGRPRIFVIDNADPEWLGRALDVLELDRTCFNVITKSGTTAETIGQFMGFHDLLAARVGKDKARKHFVLTTSPGGHNFCAKAKELGRCDPLIIPANVGGRFSELSPVGLLPAAVAGFDIRKLVAGAQSMRRVCEKPDLFENPAYLNGAIHYLADVHRGKSISVLMPYAQALREVADWYCQLWAESLGKRRGEPPHAVHVGQTPVRALGATDQHSQIQLYREGPNDKIITLIEVKEFRREFAIGSGLDDLLPDLTYLSGRRMSELLRAELDATEYSLVLSERPNLRLTLGRIDEEHIGALLFLYMAQTAFTGALYGIDAFNQPGVEEFKQSTAALMGRGTDKDKKKLEKIDQYRNRRKHEALKMG
jgi:glucose-6-phosphate isomerase